MIVVKIKALKDFELDTTLEERFLVKGEITSVKFKDKQQVEDLLKFDNFVEAGSEELEKKEIPIIRKPISSDTESVQVLKTGLGGDFEISDYLTNKVGERSVEEKLQKILDSPSMPIQVMSDSSIPG